MPTSGVSAGGMDPSQALGILQQQDAQSEQNELAVGEEKNRHKDAMAAIQAIGQ